MSLSIFMDKNQVPTNETLQNILGDCFHLWTDIRNYIFKKYPNATEEWNSSGAKHGWSFRIKDKIRAIIYLIPRDKSFMVGLVYGEKATNQARDSDISQKLKDIIEAAPVYAEGRGFRIEVTGNEMMADIEKLINIKLVN